MTRRVFILSHELARQNAIRAVQEAPAGFRVSVDEPKRTLAQNAMFHAICRDFARSGYLFAGKRRTEGQWKVLLISGHAAATGDGAEVIAGLEGEFVNVRESSAEMDKARGSSLIDYCIATAAVKGIQLTEYESWSDPKERKVAA